MKSVVVVLVFLAASAALASSQAEPPAQPGHDHSQMNAKPTEKPPNMCQQMMGEQAAELQAMSKTLATNLAQMKATLPLISDINERSRWQSNIAMWQAMADHIAHMAEHAQHMQGMGMGCGMMMGHGTGDHAGHEHTEPTPPAKPQ